MSALDCGESIYALLENSEAARAQRGKSNRRRPWAKPSYKSKAGNTAPTGSTFGASSFSGATVSNAGGLRGEHTKKRQCATMGRVAKSTVSPKKFLKKKSGTLASSGRGVSKQKSMRKRVKPEVPKRSDAPIYGLTSDKNFVRANALANILSHANRPSTPPPDELLKHENFAQVPEYLSDVKQQVQHEYEQIAQLAQLQNEEKSHVTQLSEEERLALLEELQKKWTDVNQHYQLLTHQVSLEETKKCLKEALERELDQISADIEMLSQKNVFIRED